MLVFDYNRAMAQVRELRAIASDMLRSQALSNAMTNANSAWQGRTADQFQMKCNRLAQLVRDEANNILSVADSLENSARIIEETERAAIGIITGGAVR